jgi:hypothetical protein
VEGGKAFAFVQFEFGFLLGPADGRYLLRREQGGPPERVIVLRTLGAPQRRTLGGRRAKQVERAEAEPVPTTRATLIRAEPFAGEGEGAAWLGELKADGDALVREARDGAGVLNALMRAHRAAAADPWARDVSPEQALVTRVGYGQGEQVAEGRYAAALELPRGPRKATRTERIAPQERLAAVLGARVEQLACEELVLRARADLEAGRPREAALEARIALEAVTAELEDTRAGANLGELAARRGAVGEAANAALRGDPGPELQEAVAAAVEEMERALRRYRSEALDFSGS